MLRLVLVTPRPEALLLFAAALVADPEVRLVQFATGTAALDAVRAAAPDLVIIDSGLPDANPLELVQQLLMVNAMVNTAVISGLAEDEFHEASEGLGVLGRLPLAPGESEARELLGKLRKVLGR